MKGYCKLCHQEKELRESHVISKFAYKPLKREDRCFWVLSDDPHQKNRPEQDGVKQYLLCEDCEKLRNPWETYFRNIWHRGELYGKTNPYRLSGLDYQKFKLFLLSTLFMARISDDPLFEKVELSPANEEKLRHMVWDSDPGEPEEFGCRITALEEDNVDAATFIGKAVTIKRNGVRYHRLLFAGFLWAFIDPEGLEIGQAVKDTFLTKEGTVVIRKKRIREVKYLMEMFSNLRDQGKLDV